jgi:hypothetical protein
MKTQTAIELAGSSAKLAKLIEVTPGAISQWGEQVPVNRVWQLKVIRPAWFKPDRKPAKQKAEA